MGGSVISMIAGANTDGRQLLKGEGKVVGLVYNKREGE